MKRFLLLGLSLAFLPLAASAQEAPAPPPDAVGMAAPSTAQRAAMEQVHAQLEQIRVQTRSNMIAALTPAHRAAVATLAGQLVLAANPSPRTAAEQLDAVLSPVEKQSIVNIDTARRTNTRAIMQQARAAFESSLSAEQKSKMAARESQRQAYVQSHPRPAHVADPGMILLRTLADVGGSPGGMHGRPW